MEHFDILIVGGGPAGSMAAAAALKTNPTLSVAIVDPDSNDRHRIGEALLTGTIMALADAGLDGVVAEAGFHPKIGASYVWGETRDPWYVNYPRTENDGYPEAFKDETGYRQSIHVPRNVFDPILRREVQRRGVAIIADKVRTVDTHASEAGVGILSVTTDGGRKLRAKRYIDCSGHSLALARHVTERSPIGSARVARYAYTKDIDWDQATRRGFDIHRTNIISTPSGWIWAIHLGEAGGDLTSLGFVSTPDILSKLTLENCTEAFPELEWFGFKSGYRGARTFDGKETDKFYGHPDYSFACSTLHGLNWSLAGDAALFIDPILSQGVTLAVHYGFMRGRAAALEIAGDHKVQEHATMNYLREGAVLRKVVGEWYEHNRAVSDWRMGTVMVSKALFGEDLDEVAAFRWITNLENLRNDYIDYHPYPNEERVKIAWALGLEKHLGEANK
ncbi:tryptophan 7-halogenase [Agrobacterium salinitolerans]|nr:tryptophan 7-halogenase [Agrobacterium salinitolerans]